MKSIKIFNKDIQLAFRDTLMIYIITIPILLAVCIELFAPGISDSFINVAMLKSESPEFIEFMSQNAQVELFDTQDALYERILKRDDITGVMSTDGRYEIILEGNEDPAMNDSTGDLLALYRLGAQPDQSTAQMYSLGRTEPPVKHMLTNILVLTIIMLAGMMIALGIVEEKNDNTISAVNVTPVTHSSFILGKCLPGGLISVISIVICILILGYTQISWPMILLVSLSTMLLAMTIGFLQGLAAHDIIEAAAAVKILLLPIAGGIAVYELASAKWQWTMYWNPFYWSYKANDLILAQTAQLGDIAFYTGIILVIAIVICLIAKPFIRRGLSRV